MPFNGSPEMSAVVHTEQDQVSSICGCTGAAEGGFTVPLRMHALASGTTCKDTSPLGAAFG